MIFPAVFNARYVYRTSVPDFIIDASISGVDKSMYHAYIGLIWLSFLFL
jgi:hypothetical protein